MILLVPLLVVVFLVIFVGFPLAGLYAIVSADRRIHRGHRRPSRSALVRLWRQRHP